MIDGWWKKLPDKFPSINLDEYIIMPNHLHGIINIKSSVGADPCVCPSWVGGCPPLEGVGPNRGEHTGSQYRGEHTGSPLHRMIQWFKTMSTNNYIRRVKNDNWPVFKGKLWQRNYFERIIRNEKELIMTRNYIKSNPINWKSDENNI